MKRFLLFAALLPLFFVACNKEGKTGDDNKNVVELPAPPQADYAAKIEVTPGTQLAKEVRTIEFTGEGNFVLVCPVLKEDGEPDGDNVLVYTGDFKVSHEGEDIIYDLGEIEDMEAKVILKKKTKVLDLGDYDIVFVFKAKSTNGTGSNTPPPMDDNNDDLTHLVGIWEVQETDLSVEATGFTFGKIYQHGDLHAITQDLKEQGVGVDPTKLVGYAIKTIEFTEYYSINIEFFGAKPYYGSLDDIDDKGNFVYNLEQAHNGTLFLADDAMGFVGWKTKYTAPVLALKSTFKDSANGKEYKAAVKFTLKHP